MKTPEQEHAEWVRGAIRTYEGRLVRYATQITADADRARDVVQETFIRLCDQNPEQLDSHLAEWLFTVCRHRALDLLKKEGRLTPLDEVEMNTHASMEPTPAAQAQRREELGRAAHWMAGLPENQREVMRLKFQHGLSYKEISHVTNLTISNVGVLIHTAIRTLRERMRQEEGASRT